MKTIILSLLFVACLFSQGASKLSDKFTPIINEVMVYENGSFLHQVSIWKVHSKLTSMNTEGDEKAVCEAAASIAGGLVEMIDAACRVNGFLKGESKIMTLDDAKSFCRVPAESRRLGKEYVAREIGPLVSKCRPELQEIYKNLMAIDTEVRMLAFYNTYLKDLK